MLYGGHDMATVWLIRHYFFDRQFKCKKPDCLPENVGISVHEESTKLRCPNPGSCVTSLQHAVKRDDPSHILAKGYFGATELISYLYAFASGAQVILARRVSQLSRAHAALVNEAIGTLAVYHNVLRMSRARDRWSQVEADETAWGQRKYNRGRRQRAGGVLWIGGACSISEGRVRELVARVVKNRTADVLVPMLAELVRDDGILSTDGWRAYRALTPTAATEQKKAVTHLTVNHTVGFRDNATGACTNAIEGMWRVLKYELKRRFGTLAGKGNGSVSNVRVQLGVWIVNTNLDRKYWLMRERQRQDAADAATVDAAEFDFVVDPVEESGDTGYKPPIFEAMLKLLLANYRQVDVAEFNAARYIVGAAVDSSEDDGDSDADVSEELLKKCRIALRDEGEGESQSDGDGEAEPAQVADEPGSDADAAAPEVVPPRPVSELARARAAARTAARDAKTAQKAAAKAAAEVAKAAKTAKAAEEKKKKLEAAQRKNLQKELAKRAKADGIARKRANTTTKRK
jgi:hypothetical protein